MSEASFSNDDKIALSRDIVCSAVIANSYKKKGEKESKYASTHEKNKSIEKNVWMIR